MAVFFLLAGIVLHVKANDPCTNHKPINDWTRSVANKASSSLCDSFLVDGWYKGVSEAGNELPTECPVGGFRCGAARPIWMNGTYPNAGRISSVKACAADLTNCCSKSYDIKVKNCSGYYVYYLRKTIGCAQGYCIGKELPCPTGYTSKNGFTPGCKYEPCLPINHKEIDQWERSVANKKLYGNGSLCDSFLKAGWYRPTSKAGIAMPTQCLSDGCGTVQPIWIKGNLPQTGEIANVTACASIYHNCCAHSYDIQVKNCTSFNIYNLVPTYGCAQAYCFGSEMPCSPGYTSDTGFTPGCTRTSSVLPVSSVLGANRQTRTSPVIPVSPGARLNGQPRTLPVVHVSPGAAVNGKPGALPVAPATPVSSEVGVKEHSNNNDRMWVSIFGVLCFLEIIAVVVYLMTKQIMKRKKLAKTASTTFDNSHYKIVSV